MFKISISTKKENSLESDGNNLKIAHVLELIKFSVPKYFSGAGDALAFREFLKSGTACCMFAFIPQKYSLTS